MRRIVIALAALLVVVASRAPAAELIMIEEKWCDWCALWEAEVGVVYAKTDEGRQAPLRKVDIHGDQVEALPLAMGVQYTPTFILLDDGVEIGRIEGYPGEDFFWGMLGQLLRKLPSGDAPKT